MHAFVQRSWFGFVFEQLSIKSNEKYEMFSRSKTFKTSLQYKCSMVLESYLHWQKDYMRSRETELKLNCFQQSNIALLNPQNCVF